MHHSSRNSNIIPVKYYVDTVIIQVLFFPYNTDRIELLVGNIRE